MTVLACFEKLGSDLRRFEDALTGVHVTLTVDKPPDREVALVDQLGDALGDVLGSLTEASAAARDAQLGVDYPLDLHRARRSLGQAQRAFHRSLVAFSTEVVAPHRLAEVTALGDEFGGEWPAWASTVRAALDRSLDLPLEVSGSLGCCWEELAERSAMTTVSVHTTNIGQQLSAGEPGQLLGREAT